MLRFIFYIVIFFFVYRLLNSFFKPKSQTSPSQNMGQNPRQKVTVNYDKTKSRSKVSKEVGEYVDFEEIKEEKS